MVRAQSKDELLAYSQNHWEKLWNLIDELDERTKNAHFKFNLAEKKEKHWARDKNIRDVIAHLYEWHLLLLNFVEKNSKGERIPFLPHPYNWKNYGEMNDQFQIKHQNTSLTDLKKEIFQTHQQLMTLIKSFSNEELYTKKYFNWTGTTSLGQYFQSSLSSHYDWAFKKIKEHKKTSIA
ncbi:ClbS/DfsB family four-helix bundle protein [Lactococcus sp.]|uniref:ClbS/DfsB family four-helix bundle protein n=1 Tax=Lactococcus sp. TaxID=44273 RepID=UPI002FCBD431